ncbi:MAG: hypothetical protein M3R11_01105 [Acidobacteriota bacterium]|nr:hypothetical protein [Acidobacteriota bacterium]
MAYVGARTARPHKLLTQSKKVSDKLKVEFIRNFFSRFRVQCGRAVRAPTIRS